MAMLYNTYILYMYRRAFDEEKSEVFNILIKIEKKTSF